MCNGTSRSICLVVLLASSVANAQSLTPTAKVPTTAVPCAMPDELELHATGEHPVLCWDTGCMQLDVDKATASLVEKPPASNAWLEPIAEVKTDSVCLGAKCRQLGKKLVAALAHAREYTLHPNILATANLETVVVETKAWNVHRDRPIKLAKPVAMQPQLGKNNNLTPEVSRIDIAGNLLLPHWTNCADGFCTRVQPTDGGGHAIGAHHDGGGLAPIELDADTGFVVVGEHGSVELFGMKSRKFEGAIDLAGRPWAAVRIDNGTLAVLYQTFADSNTLHVATIVWGVEPVLRAAMTLPRCARTVH
jgi:hypothetical protein